jgi:hypothetical protein
VKVVREVSAASEYSDKGYACLRRIFPTPGFKGAEIMLRTSTVEMPITLADYCQLKRAIAMFDADPGE